MPRPKADWIALRVEYVNGVMPIKSLADKYGLPVSSVEKRCAREGWNKERAVLAEKVREKATAAAVKDRTKELAEWNEGDLKIARFLRSRIAEKLNALDPAAVNYTGSLRSLAGAAESVQKMARLALGATTNNTGLSDPDGKPLNPPRLGDFYESFATFATEAGVKTGDDRAH
jgi:hypothetical protein